MFTEFNISKRNIITNMQQCNLDEIRDEFYEEVLNNFIEYLKEFDADAPYIVLRAFAITYFDFQITCDYNVATMTYDVICKPIWKDTDMIDTDSREYKLLQGYGGKLME